MNCCARTITTNPTTLLQAISFLCQVRILNMLEKAKRMSPKTVNSACKISPGNSVNKEFLRYITHVVQSHTQFPNLRNVVTRFQFPSIWYRVVHDTTEVASRSSAWTLQYERPVPRCTPSNHNITNQLLTWSIDYLKALFHAHINCLTGFPI